MWGAADKLTPKDSGEVFANTIKGSKFVVYKNVGHLPMEEVPDQSARAVREFLAPSPEPALTPVGADTPVEAPVP
jgi:pimeloyl-ACP methyl ester carboxylesterase